MRLARAVRALDRAGYLAVLRNARFWGAVARGERRIYGAQLPDESGSRLLVDRAPRGAVVLGQCFYRPA